MKIIVTERTGDIHVCPEGQPEIWACGRNVKETLGDLILSHSEYFGFEIELPKMTKE